MIKIIECSRDAMQGFPHFIPTSSKINYLNSLLQVGFDTLDFGSFVSPKAIPQLKDTEEVLAKLDLSKTQTKLLAIVANVRGAEKAADYKPIRYLGFPLSLSETFQQHNTNKSIATAFQEITQIQKICAWQQKELVVYLSMSFGNPYGDAWHPELVLDFVQRLQPLGIRIISLADTVGLAHTQDISDLLTKLIPAFPSVEFGVHLHSLPFNWIEKVKAAYDAGCRRFDGALKGFGGCPMAKNDLVGNLATENLVAYFENIDLTLNLNKTALNQALAQVQTIFTSSHG